MSAISIRLPDSLHKRIKQVAQREKVSINQMVTLAVAEKLSALETEDYLGMRASRASKNKFQKALAKVPDRPAEADDRI
jgi:predicted transcriptional regulator